MAVSGPLLTADPDRPREGGADRPLVDVAVGILLQPDGRFLLTSRPAGKVYAGYWEFPGGKLEAGEDVLQALARELQEELGISLQARLLLADGDRRLSACAGAAEFLQGHAMGWVSCRCAKASRLRGRHLPVQVRPGPARHGAGVAVAGAGAGLRRRHPLSLHAGLRPSGSRRPSRLRRRSCGARTASGYCSRSSGGASSSGSVSAARRNDSPAQAPKSRPLQRALQNGR